MEDRGAYGSFEMSLLIFLLFIHIQVLGIFGSRSAMGDLRHVFLQSRESRFGIPVPWCVGCEQKVYLL